MPEKVPTYLKYPRSYCLEWGQTHIVSGLQREVGDQRSSYVGEHRATAQPVFLVIKHIPSIYQVPRVSKGRV